jgi:hypothetical protein
VGTKMRLDLAICWIRDVECTDVKDNVARVVHAQFADGQGMLPLFGDTEYTSNSVDKPSLDLYMRHRQYRTYQQSLRIGHSIGRYTGYRTRPAQARN